MAKLDVKAFGLALGIIWAVSVFLLGMIAMLLKGYCLPFVTWLGSMYIGYKATLLGSIIGAIWGFVDAGIGGVLVAWLYNKLSR